MEGGIYSAAIYYYDDENSERRNRLRFLKSVAE